MTSAPPASARVVITPPSRFPIPDFAGVWEAREILWRFGLRDITLRYRQTALGVIWVVLQPLLSAGVFTVVFGKVAKLPTGGIPYFLFSFAGMLAWNVINNILGRGSGALVANAALVSKVFFPRVLVPLSIVCSVLVDFVVGLVMMLVLLVIYGVNPGLPILLTPIWLLLAILLSSGLAVVLSALTVRYRDVSYIVPFLTQLLLYASPIAYALSAVPKNLRPLFEANPITWILEEFRWSVLGTAQPPAWQIIASVVVSAGVFLGGMLIFESMERGLADVI